MVKMGIRMEGKGDFRDFECGMIVDARQAGLNIQYLIHRELLGFSHSAISRAH